jgi:chemotaxis protein CheC
MIGKPVVLSVPKIEFLTNARAAFKIGEQVPGTLLGVSQTFDGDLRGRALLIFPEADGFELVRAMSGEDMTIEDVDLTEEGIVEAGNIILNNCVATIANLLKRTSKISLPAIIRGSSRSIFVADGDAAQEAVLFLYMDFSVKGQNIRGYVAMLMDMPALDSLRLLLREFIFRVTGKQPPSYLEE